VFHRESQGEVEVGYLAMFACDPWRTPDKCCFSRHESAIRQDRVVQKRYSTFTRYCNDYFEKTLQTTMALYILATGSNHVWASVVGKYHLGGKTFYIDCRWNYSSLHSESSLASKLGSWALPCSSFNLTRYWQSQLVLWSNLAACVYVVVPPYRCGTSKKVNLPHWFVVHVIQIFCQSPDLPSPNGT